MIERIKVEYFEQPPIVVEVGGGSRSWQAETADPFCDVWYETTEGCDRTRRWVKSSLDGCMTPEDSEGNLE